MICGFFSHVEPGSKNVVFGAQRPDYRSDKSTIDTLRRSDFYISENYIAKADSTMTVILKDSIGHIVAMRQTRKGINIFVAEYYPNGQLKGKVTLTDSSVDAGSATYYYEDGRVRSEGDLRDGKRIGTWKDYDREGSPGKPDNQ
jgi:antitoxin component YwqK of YwqJK toxin-antitoxin module